MDTFIVTCEHGGNRIPAAYRSLFRGQQQLLNSHRGYDAGALAMARSLATALDAPLVASNISRLLIDLNRPAGHPQLYSALTRSTQPELRTEIATRHHQPYLEEIERLIGSAVGSGQRAIHISSHSFTPELNGLTRRADIGLLYDPGREGEVELSARWKAKLTEYAPTLRVRRNYPYQGKAAGLTAHLRRCFPSDSYIGIELEINQDIVMNAGRCWTDLRRVVPRSLLAASAEQAGVCNN